MTECSFVFWVEGIFSKLFGEAIEVDVLMFWIEEEGKSAFHIFLFMSV